jgi:hypothetical protein
MPSKKLDPRRHEEIVRLWNAENAQPDGMAARNAFIAAHPKKG